jgi:hypothetical protein
VNEHPDTQDALTRELRALADEPVPADVVARLDARLAAELAQVPLAARRRGRLRLVPALGAAAAAAACVGMIAFALTTGGGSGSDGDTVALTAERSSAPAAAESATAGAAADAATTTAAGALPAATSTTGAESFQKSSPAPTTELGRVVVAAAMTFELRVRANVAAACEIEGTSCPAPVT